MSQFFGSLFKLQDLWSGLGLRPNELDFFLQQLGTDIKLQYGNLIWLKMKTEVIKMETYLTCTSEPTHLQLSSAASNTCP